MKIDFSSFFTFSGFWAARTARSRVQAMSSRDIVQGSGLTAPTTSYMADESPLVLSNQPRDRWNESSPSSRKYWVLKPGTHPVLLLIEGVGEAHALDRGLLDSVHRLRLLMPHTARIVGTNADRCGGIRVRNPCARSLMWPGQKPPYLCRTSPRMREDIDLLGPGERRVAGPGPTHQAMWLVVGPSAPCIIQKYSELVPPPAPERY